MGGKGKWEVFETQQLVLDHMNINIFREKDSILQKQKHYLTMHGVQLNI